MAARESDNDFAPLPGTPSYEVAARLPGSFKPTIGPPCNSALAADASEAELDRLSDFRRVLMSGYAERQSVAMEGRRYGDCFVDSPVLRQLAGPTNWRSKRAMPKKADALREAKTLAVRGLRHARRPSLSLPNLSGGVERGKGAKARPPAEVADAVPTAGDNVIGHTRHRNFWAAFVLTGDPD